MSKLSLQQIANSAEIIITKQGLNVIYGGTGSANRQAEKPVFRQQFGQQMGNMR